MPPRQKIPPFHPHQPFSNKMKSAIPHLVKLFVPLAFIMTVMAGLVYVAVQQNFRMNANDPQIQIAEDLATQLSAGAPVGPNSLTTTVDISRSLSPYVLIYDNHGEVITGSGKLNDQFPSLPSGVFDNAKKVGENRITWQPQADVRGALVVVRYQSAQSSGYVAVGRSLREVEQRESMLGWQVLGAWLAGLIGLIILIIGSEFIFSGRSSQ